VSRSRWGEQWGWGARTELLAGVLGGLEPRCIGVGDLLGELECAAGLGSGKLTTPCERMHCANLSIACCAPNSQFATDSNGRGICPVTLISRR
jgi:hypothetical protein